MSALLSIKRFAFTWHLSESLWTTNSNERQADSRDELSEWCKDKRDSTALGRGSNGQSWVPEKIEFLWKKRADLHCSLLGRRSQIQLLLAGAKAGAKSSSSQVLVKLSRGEVATSPPLDCGRNTSSSPSHIEMEKKMESMPFSRNRIPI